MDKVELYRQVYFTIKGPCADGKQSCSLHTYCKVYGVDQSQMPMVLKDEYIPVTKFPRYVRDGGKALICSRIYEDFKKLCAQGKQPCARPRGITKDSESRGSDESWTCIFLLRWRFPKCRGHVPGHSEI